MGVSYGLPAKPELTKAESDIKYLGSRYPFGDDELWKLYKAFYRVQNSDEKVSFISDWAVQCVEIPDSHSNGEDSKEILEELKKERLRTMQVVEHKILPPDFSQRLQETTFSNPAYDSQCEPGLEAFFSGLSNVDRRGGRCTIGVLFDYFSVKKNSIPETSAAAGTSAIQVADFNEILHLAYRLSVAAAFLESAKQGRDGKTWIPPQSLDEKAIEGFSHSLTDFIKRKRIRDSPYGTVAEDPYLDKGFVEKVDLQEWVELNAPVLASSLSTFLFHVFFPDKPFPQTRTALSFPRLLQDSVFFTEATSPLLFSFACLSNSLGGSWHRLYSSSSDGLSYNRLQNALLGYGGPTLMIIEETCGTIFGAFTGSPWKESKDFYGQADCFLYQLIPITAIYRPSGNGTNFMYCNSEARSRGYDGQAHGIGFGGDVHSPRLFITETFENCVASSHDLTFECGPLLPKTASGGLQKTFDIETLEVWGVGGDEVVGQALGARHQQREITAANIRKARKVDKAAFLDDFQSGLIESKAFAHRGQMRGRADEDTGDDKYKVGDN